MDRETPPQPPGFPLERVIRLRRRGHPEATIARHISEEGYATSEATVRDRLLEAGYLHVPPFRHVIQSAGRAEDGWGQAAARRVRQKLTAHGWRRNRAWLARTTVRWPACPLTTGASSAAVGVLLSLLTAPRDVHVRVEAPDDVISLLEAHRDTPESSPLPAFPAELLASVSLHGIELAASTKLPAVPLPADAPELSHAWLGKRELDWNTQRPAVPGQQTMTSEEPEHGAWITDYSATRDLERGFGAFYRYTHMPLSMTPVYVVPLPGCRTSGDGEATVALLAHAFARMSGEQKPVVHTDSQGTFGNLAKILASGLDSPRRLETSYKTMLSYLPEEEILALNLRWTTRSHPTIGHADAVARAFTTSAELPSSGKLAKAKRCAVELEFSDVIRTFRDLHVATRAAAT